MNATTLAKILEAADGVEGSDARFEVSDGHRLTFYLGRPGQAMEAKDLVQVQVDDGFVALRKRDDESTLYVPIEVIAAIGVRRAKDGEGRRAGF